MQTIRAATLYTGTGVIADATLAWEGDRIATVGQGAATGPVYRVTPAFIDAHSHIGLIRRASPAPGGPTTRWTPCWPTPMCRLDQMDDAGDRSSGRAGPACCQEKQHRRRPAVIRNYASNTNEALVRRAWLQPHGRARLVGRAPTLGRRWRCCGSSRTTCALLAAEAAAAAGGEGEPPRYTADETVLRALLRREQRLRVHVHKSDDVAALLRFVDEFGLDVVIEHTGDVHDDRTYRELARRGIPVVYGPLDSLAYKVELKHESWRNLAYLVNSGVTFGLMTDHPVILQRTLLLTLRWFLRVGLSKQAALEIITRQNAAILGVDDVLGTLAPGKWASFVCWSGDPFSLQSYPLAVYGEGALVHQEA